MNGKQDGSGIFINADGVEYEGVWNHFAFVHRILPLRIAKILTVHRNTRKHSRIPPKHPKIPQNTPKNA